MTVSRRHDDESAFLSQQPPRYYQAVLALLKPLYRLSVWRRSRQRDNYADEVAQRFGHQYPPRPQPSTTDSLTKPSRPTDAHPAVQRSDIEGSDVEWTGTQQPDTQRTSAKLIWCHAVSLGETNTAAPLLDELLAQGHLLWLTNTTQTGYARGRTRFASAIASGQMAHSYVPVDLAAVVERFLAHVRPDMALFIETELWATTLSMLAEKHIPSVLVNARLSERSYQRYQRIAQVSQSMMHNLSLIIAQDADTAKRFRQLGADSHKIRIAGSLKWVIAQGVSASLSEQQQAEGKRLREQWGNSRPVWVAASTHEGEEQAVLAVHKQLLASAGLSDALLILVPRHPERFDTVATLVEKSTLKQCRRSTDDIPDSSTQVYLADTMGELLLWYSIADAAFVGGSLVDVGGHNPIEALSMATPVLMGQYTHSCQDVVATLLRHQVMRQCGDVTDTRGIYEGMYDWLSNLAQCHELGKRGQQLVATQQHTLDRQLAMIQQQLQINQQIHRHYSELDA